MTTVIPGRVLSEEECKEYIGWRVKFVDDPYMSYGLIVDVHYGAARVLVEDGLIYHFPVAHSILWILHHD